MQCVFNLISVHAFLRRNWQAGHTETAPRWMAPLPKRKIDGAGISPKEISMHKMTC